MRVEGTPGRGRRISTGSGGSGRVGSFMRRTPGRRRRRRRDDVAVVDASVVDKWYIPERDHEAARDHRDAYLDGHHDLLAPSLLPFEVINALEFSGHYDGDRLREASRTLPEYGLEFVPYRAAGPVAAVAQDLNVTISDASYVSLASTRNGTLYTADTELLDAANRGQYSGETAHIRAYEST